MAAKTLDRVTNRVKEDWVVGLAKKLIDIPSFKTEESQIALFLASNFRRWGYEVDLAGGRPRAGTRLSQRCGARGVGRP